MHSFQYRDANCFAKTSPWPRRREECGRRSTFIAPATILDHYRRLDARSSRSII